MTQIPVGRGAAALLTESEAVIEQLGLAFEGRLAGIRSFLEGPPLLAVAGNRWSGRSAITEHIGDQSPAIEAVEIPYGEGPGLWDAIVVTTPLEAALSDDDLGFIKRFRALRRPVLVAVTGFGERDDEVDRALDEIGRLRLVPRLGPMNVDWLPWGEGEPPDDARSRIARLLSSSGPASHERPALDALSAVLVEASARMDARVLVRDQERQRLADEERSLPMALSHLAETARLARLRLRDDLRSCLDDLHQSADEMAGALDEWVLLGGRGELDDATDMLADGWKRFVQAVGEALAEAVAAFHAEAARVVDRSLEAFAEMQIERPGGGIERGTWLGEHVDGARARLVGLDLEPLVTAAVHEARIELEARQRDDSEQAPGVEEGGAPLKPPPRAEAGVNGQGDGDAEGFVSRARDALVRLKGRAEGGAAPVLERLNLLVAIYIQAQVSVRLDKLMALASADVEEGARADVERYGQLLRDRVTLLRTALEHRHAWTRDYLALTRLVERTDEARRAG